MTRRPQAKDIPETLVYCALAATRGRHGVPQWSTLSDVCDHLSAFPPKVVQARLRSMIRRGLLYGCACGCRGDFGVDFLGTRGQ